MRRNSAEWPRCCAVERSRNRNRLRFLLGVDGSIGSDGKGFRRTRRFHFEFMARRATDEKPRAMNVTGDDSGHQF
jgi:hypothetical protein